MLGKKEWSNIFIFITQKVKPNLQVFEKQREITKWKIFLRNTEVSMHFYKKKSSKIVYILQSL